MVSVGQVWVMSNTIILVIRDASVPTNFAASMPWWHAMDLETGNIYHLGDAAFGMDSSDELLFEPS